jgi:hypothetical protein
MLAAIADRPLVNIQPDVIHTLHGRASLLSLNRSLSPALYTKRSFFDLYIQTYQALAPDSSYQSSSLNHLCIQYIDC